MAKLLSKIVMLVFLGMIVLGFTAPGFIDTQGSSSYVEPRVCQSDADCYLDCGNAPEAVLCSQNLCVKNSCSEGNYYPLKSESISFSLSVNLDGESVALSGNNQDLFITFGEQVNVFSNGLNLNQVLDKTNMVMNNQCIRVSGKTYCNDDEKLLSLNINGEESLQLVGYIPKDGDIVEISFS